MKTLIYNGNTKNEIFLFKCYAIMRHVSEHKSLTFQTSYHFFWVCHPNLLYKKACFVSFLTNIFFWNLDKRWRSYELFSLPCFFCLISCVFLLFLFFCFFYFWKTPLTLFLFNFIYLLTLGPFILCFILLYLRIQCICHGLFLWAKIDFTFSPPPCFLVNHLWWTLSY